MNLDDKPFRSAFTLLEMLAVIAIMALLVAGVLPAYNAIASAKDMDRNAYDLAGLVELARGEAVARHTYVWLGFSTINNAGSSEVLAGGVFSLDGSGTNTNASNMSALGKVIHLRNVKLAPWSDLKAGTRALLTNQVPASLASNTTGTVFSIGSTTFSTTTLTITPNGEVCLSGQVGPDDGFDPCIDISIRQTHGTTVAPDADDAAVVIDGGAVMSQIILIQ